MNATCPVSSTMAPFTLANYAKYAKNEGYGIYVLHANYGKRMEAKERACGTCGSCHFRRRAFTALGKTDPIPYEGD